MEDEIHVDIVELIDKNEHERGLSNPTHFHKKLNLHKDGRGLKRKKEDLSQSKHKSKVEPKLAGEENLQTSLRNHFTSDLQVNNGHKYVSRVSAIDNSCISDKEGITFGSCIYHRAVLQSTQWFIPLGKHSPGFVAPILDEKNIACDQHEPFSIGNMELDFMRLKGA